MSGEQEEAQFVFTYALQVQMDRFEARREDYAWLRSQGEPVDEAGARVGISPYTARHRYEHAFQAGELA